MVHFAAYINGTLMLLNNPIRNGKPQASSSSHRFCGKEGIKNVGDDFFGNALARISELDHDAVT